ncbi:MAG TPA: alginate lyase family protein [Azospira sp.]|nr:alginate lyase family protein [Azospira sp.]
MPEATDTPQYASNAIHPALAPWPPGAAADRLAALRWRLNRLRCMGPGEILHRLRRLAQAHAERLLPAAAWPLPTADLGRVPTPWIGIGAGIDASGRIDRSRCLAAAERLQQGRFDVFALHDIDLGWPPRWNRDPKTGTEAPRRFGKLLDYRDPRLVGDIKYLWEPNRHLHLVTLAQAWALSGDERHLALIRAHLESWFAACPPGLGANWSSALEAGLRLINWSLAWQLAGGVASPLFAGASGSRFRDAWLASVYRHAQFVRGHLSLHSSANNHLIGEAAGLFLAGLAWPHWPQAEAWRTTGRRLLIREAALQNAPDGVNREQAVSYQQFELDLLLLPLLAARANGDDFPADYVARIEAMLDYLASIMDVGGHVPMIGDADDGAAVRLAAGDGFCPYRSLLATGAILFGRADFKAKAGPLDDKTRWLLGSDADAQFAALPTWPPPAKAGAGTPPRAPALPSLPVRRAFPDGGYYILGRDFEGDDEIRLVADAGPLGYGGIAAHGHADALAFTLSVGGCEFLVDPGTYAYHTEAEWRAYFRGTAAHNTLRVDGRDQSEPGGNFLWLAKAAAGCSRWHSSLWRDEFAGWHDGYRRLPDPVRHERQIALDKRSGRIVIDDRLRMQGSHDIELFFHCHEDCRIDSVGGEHFIRHGGRTIRLRLPLLPAATVRVLRGSTAPIAGWISRRFDQRVPAPTLHWRARLLGASRLRTEIDVGG